MGPVSDLPPDRQPEVIARVERLASLADQRWALLPAEPDADLPTVLDPDAPTDASPASPPGPRDRARELRQTTRGYLQPRARDLDAPLVIVLLGPTGSGKSTLFNTIAGTPISRTGVLRPTTRHAIVVATAADAQAVVADGPLAAIPPDRLEVRDEGARPGVVVVDAPDVDSVEHDNRALADTLLELADLCVFVTTATRYADRVSWDVLARAEQRRVPLVVVVNRLPAGEDAAAVLDDVDRLLARTSLAAMDVVAVAEGALNATGRALDRDAVEPLMARIVELSRDRATRRALAERALAGAVAGLAPLVAAIGADLEAEATDADSLRRAVAADHADEGRLLRERLTGGTVLREEVIRHWHSYVGADQITRLFSTGVGKVRGTILALVRGTPAPPVSTVQQGAADDVAAVVVAHASEAARRAAAHWAADPVGADLVAANAGLWSASPDLAARTRLDVDEWVREIAADVATTGADKRGVARVASLGVNAGAITIMLLTFAHTGGITGAEVGIAAATAFLNQKLMNALFGEAAVHEMIDRARERLVATIDGLMAGEQARFTALVADGAELRALGAALEWTVDGSHDGDEADP
jgi:energy-coupling factor transporter ATP-binding protein EcfA2